MSGSARILTLFCEDIREEKSGMVTLVGLLPDALTVAFLPGMMPKLCAWTRVTLDVDDRPPGFSVFLDTPDGQRLGLGSMDAAAISAAADEAQAAGRPTYGIMIWSVMAPFRAGQAGRYGAMVKLGDAEMASAYLSLSATQKLPDGWQSVEIKA